MLRRVQTNASIENNLTKRGDLCKDDLCDVRGGVAAVGTNVTLNNSLILLKSTMLTKLLNLFLFRTALASVTSETF
jgi:hypothetical protein